MKEAKVFIDSIERDSYVVVCTNYAQRDCGEVEYALVLNNNLRNFIIDFLFMDFDIHSTEYISERTKDTNWIFYRFYLYGVRNFEQI